MPLSPFLAPVFASSAATPLRWGCGSELSIGDEGVVLLFCGYGAVAAGGVVPAIGGIGSGGSVGGGAPLASVAGTPLLDVLPHLSPRLPYPLPALTSRPALALRVDPLDLLMPRFPTPQASTCLPAPCRRPLPAPLHRGVDVALWALVGLGACVAGHRAGPMLPQGKGPNRINRIWLHPLSCWRVFRFPLLMCQNLLPLRWLWL